MFLLITYDVSTVEKAGTKRLRQVARACEDYGQRIQKSVFECTVGASDWATFRARLLTIINEKEDSLRFYYLDQDVKIEHHGTNSPIDMDGPLVI